VYASTEAKLLAVQPTIDVLAAGAVVPADPWRRRLQALVAIGWTKTWIAEQCGVTRQNFTTQMRSAHVTAATARTWRDLYDRMHMTPGPSVRARQLAQQQGWAPPLAWNDIDAGVLAGNWRRRSAAS
jgi:hypothetical protein